MNQTAIIFRDRSLQAACQEVLGLRPEAPPCGHVRLADGFVFAPGQKKHLLSQEGIEELEAALLEIPGADSAERLDLEHLFAPGIYIRQIFMPAGEFITGAIHNFEHFNTVLTGRASVIMKGIVHEIVAPNCFISEAGVRKVLWIHEDMVWQTIHPNPDDCRDIAVLEERLAKKTEAYVRHFEGMKTLQEVFNNAPRK